MGNVWSICLSDLKIGGIFFTGFLIRRNPTMKILNDVVMKRKVSEFKLYLKQWDCIKPT